MAARGKKFRLRPFSAGHSSHEASRFASVGALRTPYATISGMIRLELTDQEARLLKEILEAYGSDTRFESARTDSGDYRAELKERIGLAAKISERLGRETATSAKSA